jgi:hypothetical protein
MSAGQFPLLLHFLGQARTADESSLALRNSAESQPVAEWSLWKTIVPENEIEIASATVTVRSM